MRKQRARHRGAALTESVIGIVFLVILSLALLDLGTVLLAGEQCGALAKQSARAAANASNLKEAKAAVIGVAGMFEKTNLYKSVTVKMDQYDGTEKGNLHINCIMVIYLPVAVPLFSVGPTVMIHSQSTEPILGIAPPPPS